MPKPMPKTLAFIHTSPLTIPVFASLATEKMPDIEIFHMLDESLLKNTLAAGRLEKATVRRLVGMVESAGQAGADVVMVACSSIGPAVDVARRMVDFPVVRVDEAMAEEAVWAGERIGVAATLASTLEPTCALIRSRAKTLGLERTIVERLCAGAFDAVRRGDAEEHDRIVGEGLEELAGEADVIVLAQASMARVAETLPPEKRTVPILSSPASGVDRARLALEEL